MMGNTRSSTKRPTESWTARSSSVRRPRTSYKSVGFSMAASLPARLTNRLSVGEPEAAVEVRHQPDGPDQQELHVLEEGRPRPLDGMADELPDPGDDDDGEADRPQRPRERVEPAHDEQHRDQA